MRADLLKYQNRIERKRRRLERKYAKAFRAYLRKETKAIRSLLERNPLGYRDELDVVLSRVDMEEVYRSMYFDSVEAFKIVDPERVIKAEPTGDAWDEIVRQHLASYGLTRIEEMRRTTKELTVRNLDPILQQGIEGGLGIGEISRTMQATLAEYAPKAERYRAERIARTEIISSSNWASLKSVEISGASERFKKRWLPAQQSNTREDHLAMMNEPAIALDETFLVGGERLAYPGDPAGSPGNTINCRCTVVYERVNEE